MKWLCSELCKISVTSNLHISEATLTLYTNSRNLISLISFSPHPQVTAAGLVLDAKTHRTAHSDGTSLLFRAVTMYYEARDALLQTLNRLLVIRHGRTYGETVSPAFHIIATE